ncbi:MAG: hypothetical protein FJ125_14450 [Deltaproteobacteria bacterium]|nr:hypothetical protein [Deltaproteobacteria bacterium]
MHPPGRQHHAPQPLTDRALGLLVAVVAAFLAGLLVAYVLLAPRQAAGGTSTGRLPGWVRVSPEVAARLDAAWPEIELAAAMAQLEPELLAGLLVVETGCQPLEGRGYYGHGQIGWRWFAPLLRGEGWRLEDLLHDSWGVIAVRRGLQHLRWLRPGIEDWRLVCWWGAGEQAWSFRQDCDYQRQVWAAAREVWTWRSSGTLGAGR